MSCGVGGRLLLGLACGVYVWGQKSYLVATPGYSLGLTLGISVLHNLL